MDKVKWGVLGTAGIAMGSTIPGMLQAENRARQFLHRTPVVLKKPADKVATHRLQ